MTSLIIHFSIDASHPCLAGHFPGNPVVPAVILLDELMQAVENEEGTIRVRGIKQVKFVRPVLPAQRIDVEVTDIVESPRFNACCNGLPVFSGELIIA